MSKSNNAVWRFFASVKLALFILILLATISIFGTLITQGQDHSKYVQEYGETLTNFLEFLGLTNMYSSWWYIALLILFAINLVVCSIERLPRVWRLVTLNNLDTDAEQLEKRKLSSRLITSLTNEEIATRVLETLGRNGWKKSQRSDKENFSILFVQKGAWTRLGVYVVHFSILIVLLGAIIGKIFGYEAYVFIPEGTSTETIFLRPSKEAVPLDFKLQCDKFEKVFYANGMTKQFKADLSVHDSKLVAPIKKSVIVNDPLSYNGLTFYVGDSFPLQEYLVVIRNHNNNTGQAFRAAPDVDVKWQGTDISFRLEEPQLDQDGNLSAMALRFSSGGSSELAKLQINNEATVEFNHAGTVYSTYLHQYQSVLLLVTKDPGVLTVYLGCALMVTGLLICLFLSHRRIWVHIAPASKGKQKVLISGDSNKNKLSFEQQLQNLTDQIEQSLSTRK